MASLKCALISVPGPKNSFCVNIFRWSNQWVEKLPFQKILSLWFLLLFVVFCFSIGDTFSRVVFREVAASASPTWVFNGPICFCHTSFCDMMRHYIITITEKGHAVGPDKAVKGGYGWLWPAMPGFGQERTSGVPSTAGRLAVITGLWRWIFKFVKLGKQ